MTLKYTTVGGFWKFLGIKESILDFNPGDTPSREVVTSTSTSGDYYLDQLGVDEDNLTLYVGNSNTELTLGTDYTFDSDYSKVTITASGAAVLGGTGVQAVYDFNQLGKFLTYNETATLLEQSEDSVEDSVNGVFANQSDTNPSYKSIVDEYDTGKGGFNNLYQLFWRPVVKLSTTVSSDYTTGGTSIVLSDATGFPQSATIYIGGSKVSYTNKTSNTLTIPSTTTSVSGGAIVLGEVIEVSTSPSGVDPVFTVLTPDSDYNLDYDTGELQLQDDYYFATDTPFSKPQDGVKGRIRYSYQHAWHQPGADAEIPVDIQETTYMIAGRKLAQRTVLKSITGQRDNFNPQSFGFSKIDIDEALMSYKMLKFTNV